MRASYDLGRNTVHFNRHYLDNFALGFDYYRLYDHKSQVHQASIFQLNFLFFNVTFTRWQKWI
jgi:hypothetical protein